MNHHKPEEWLLYMEGEAPGELAATLSQHLKSCPECVAELEAWKRSAKRLRQLPFPARQTISWPVARVLRMGWAAAIVLAVGVAAGRWSAPNAEKMEAEMRAQLHDEVRVEMQRQVGALTRQMEKERASDRREVIGYVSDVRDQNAIQCMSLRRDLETAVSEADNGLKRNSQRIKEVVEAALTAQR